MNIILFTIPIALLLGAGFVCAFLWATSQGQFDDLDTPAMRMLKDEDSNMGYKKTIFTDAVKSKQKNIKMEKSKYERIR